MYQVYFDQYPLDDPRDETLLIRDPDTHLAVGEAGSMAFTIDHDHPYASRLTRFKGAVKLLADGRAIFRGRIRKDTREFNLSRRIEVEGLLACLNDSIIPPFTFPDDFSEDEEYIAAAESGNVVQFLLGWFLDQHNSQVGAGQQILLGDVTVTDPNNYITRASSEYLTTMDAVRKKLVDLLGGYLLPDYSGETTVLHYYADLPLTNVQEVEYGENLLDLVSELDDAETYTAILPMGADGLTLESLSDGEISPGIWKEGRIIYSKEAEDAIEGRITKQVIWSGVTVAKNLQTKAAALLTAEGARTTQTLTVKAIDLGQDGSQFAVGQYVRLSSAPHGFAASYPLMELDPDIHNPGNTQITMGSTVKAATDIAHANQSAVEERQDQQQIELNNQQSHITGLTQSVMEQITSAIQTSEAIIFEALKSYVETSDYEQYKETVESTFTQLSDRIELVFTQTTDSITEVNGELQRTVETLSKHFDFTADGLVIRDGANTMSLTLDNGMILFKKNGVQFGHWDGVDFYTGNIVVELNERAQFGNFAAIPRNSGSLSWLKVKG